MAHEQGSKLQTKAEKFGVGVLYSGFQVVDLLVAIRGLAILTATAFRPGE